jgi:hypothetical protein
MNPDAESLGTFFFCHEERGWWFTNHPDEDVEDRWFFGDYDACVKAFHEWLNGNKDDNV